jgi:cell division protein FtsB
MVPAIRQKALDDERQQAAQEYQKLQDKVDKLKQLKKQLESGFPLPFAHFSCFFNCFNLSTLS